MILGETVPCACSVLLENSSQLTDGDVRVVKVQDSFNFEKVKVGDTSPLPKQWPFPSREPRNSPSLLATDTFAYWHCRLADFPASAGNIVLHI